MFVLFIDCTGAQVRSPIFTSLTTIPGAVVGIMPRYDGLGYQLEASIPLALVPEVTQVKVSL